MTFQVDVIIKRIGHIVVIEGSGISVNFDPKNYNKTLNALIDSCKLLQPDLVSDKDEMDYLTRSVQIQLTEIYKEYELEVSDKKTILLEAKDTGDIVEEVSEAIMERHRLLTIEETREIRYYHNGAYIPGGDILIEKEAEAIYGYGLANRHLSEIKGHIMRTFSRLSII
jgi:hypothetical protein